MKPICLITPPSCFLLDERVFPSLGILKVAAALGQAGYQVEHLDLSGTTNYLEIVAAHAAQTEAKIFGLTATTPQLPACVKVVEVLRRVRPDARIILGGPHVTLVNAAWRNERKKDIVARASRALDKLMDMFDVLVAGDGEVAVLASVKEGAPKLIDADDWHSGFFLTNEELDAAPFPARHLIDMDSYHYTIDGERATSMIAQLGCLAPGTPIRLANGRDVPIETILVGDRVVCWDEENHRLTTDPVAKVWSREADDIWRLTFTSCDDILVTSEHPVLTSNGWKRVVDLGENDQIALVPNMQKAFSSSDVSRLESQVLQPQMSEAACSARMPSLQEEIRARSSSCSRSQLLLSKMPMGVDERPRQSRVDEGWPASDEDQVAAYGHRRTPGKIQHQDITGSGNDCQGSQDTFRNQDGRQKSDEAPGSRREGFQDDQRSMGDVLLSANEKTVEGRKNKTDVGARCDERPAEFKRDAVAPHSEYGSADFFLRRERCFLDRSLPIGAKEKSGFFGQSGTQSNFVARGILAFQRISGNRDGGLSNKRMGRLGDLVVRTPASQTGAADSESSRVRFTRIQSKTFVGRGKVHNITVCPGHSYVANNVVVHNCPFACGFCGGRSSPMLRRVRTRSTESVVAELRHLYETYGVRGAMLYDDELNVNKQVVELMDAIAALGADLGIAWKLRGFVKAELFTEAQAAAMHHAGFRWLLVGFESGSPRILKNINKKATREQNSRCLQIARAHGIKVKALMSLGHPGESAETVAETQAWLLEQRPDDFDATVITTYPGTPYYDEAAEARPGIWTYTARNGDRLHAEDVDFRKTAEYYKGVPGEYRSFVWTDYLSSADIVRLRDRLESDVRQSLRIPYNHGAPGARYEASMGMLPGRVLRSTIAEGVVA